MNSVAHASIRVSPVTDDGTPPGYGSLLSWMWCLHGRIMEQ
ncbi:hypothetical protein [Pseudomonas cremoricolorata]|nr:hypothetical protein [Pseudomonas cremoricolorata]